MHTGAPVKTVRVPAVAAYLFLWRMQTHVGALVRHEYVEVLVSVIVAYGKPHPVAHRVYAKVIGDRK